MTADLGWASTSSQFPFRQQGSGDQTAAAALLEPGKPSLASEATKASPGRLLDADGSEAQMGNDVNHCWFFLSVCSDKVI